MAATAASCACALSSLSAGNGHSNRAPVACLTFSNVSTCFSNVSTCHSMGIRTPPLRLCGLSIFSPTVKAKKRNQSLSRNVAVTPRASTWNDDVEGEEAEEENTRENGYRNSSRELSVFVGNLPFSVDSAALADLFKDTCNFSMVEVKYDQESGRSRGFGFLTMETAEDVAEAVEKFNGYEFQGRALRVNAGPPPARNNSSPRGGFRNERSGGGFRNERSGGGFRNERSGGDFNSANRMFVGNIPWGADNFTLEQLFGSHGRVVDARVVYDRESGRSRGFGFVTMSSAQEVEAAIASLDGADMDGRPLRVSVAESKPARF